MIRVVARDVRASARGVRPARGRVALATRGGVLRGESASPLEMLYLRGPVAVVARHFHAAVSVRREWSPNIRLTVMNWLGGGGGRTAAGRADDGAARGPEMKLRLNSPVTVAARPVVRAGAEAMAERVVRRLRRTEANETRAEASTVRRNAAIPAAAPAMVVAQRRAPSAADAPPAAAPTNRDAAAVAPPQVPVTLPDVNRLTEQVIQGIDRRLKAERERYGSI